ncbi:MAG TPA: hypothetical protein VFT74_18665, partial [Isosphaeraceae bacterium]|nr:hypothetical protein [Isosphaeraceae bacterium]
CAPGCPPTDALYGVVFFNGAMTFRTLGEIAGNQLCPTYVNPAPPIPGTAVPGPVPGELRTPNEGTLPGALETAPAGTTQPVPVIEEETVTPPIPNANLVGPGPGALNDAAPLPLDAAQPASFQPPADESSLADTYASEPLDLNALPPLPQ